MADYVLIHGGHKDGSIWDKVVPILEERGHRTFAPSLPEPKTSTLSEFIDVVCKLFEDEGLDGVILVGHSSGSLVITGVADRMPERIGRLVYVDSSVPIVGKRLRRRFLRLSQQVECTWLATRLPAFLRRLKSFTASGVLANLTSQS